MKVDGFEIEIFKEPVLYFISLRCEIKDNNETFVHTIPIVAGITDIIDDASDDINGYTVHLDHDDVVLGIIPAPVGMFKVSAWISDWDTPMELGFEYPGTQKDWTKIATALAKLNQQLKLKREGLK